MTELENLKAKLFELVECVGALETKPNGDVLIFTKEQLLTYSRFLIDETIKDVIENIKYNVDQNMIDESIELEIGFSREIEINIDERAIQRQIISAIEDSVTEDIEGLVDNTLNITFPANG